MSFRARSFAKPTEKKFLPYEILAHTKIKRASARFPSLRRIQFLHRCIGKLWSTIPIHDAFGVLGD